MQINNSEKMSIDNIKWKNPGASLYNELCEEDNWGELLKEAYIVAPVNNIDVNPDHKTPFTRSGCKYPHHIIKDGKLVLSRSGVRAAYSRMKQMGIYKGEYKNHIDSHLKELGMMNDSGVHYEDTINDNFNDIQMYIENSLNVSFDDSYLDDALFEASHGKLKYDYRQVKDVNTGHTLLCVYSLNNIKVTYPGHAWEGHIPDQHIEKIAKTDPEKAKQLREIKARDNAEVQANIHKKGNTDHQSYGQQLLVVKDLTTGQQWSAYKHTDTNLRKNLEKSKDFGKEFKVQGYFRNDLTNPIFTIKLGEVESEANKTFKSTKNFTKIDGIGNIKKYDTSKLPVYEDEYKFFRGVEKDNIVKLNKKIITDKYGNEYSIGNNILFKANISHEIAIIPEGVKEIGDNVFYNCKSLKSINIHKSVKKIGGSAFAGCSYLESVTLPEGLEEIEGGLFSDCESLKSINIPKSVKKIGNGAFSRCSSLKSINIPKSVKKISSSAFIMCKSLTSVNLPEGLEEIGRMAFIHCTFLKSINIPKSVKKIDKNAFRDCTSLPENIKEQIRKINPDAIFESTNIDGEYDIFNESIEVFEEKSHGKLNSAFRIAANIENGHFIKIIFDLKSKSVLQIGDHANQHNRNIDKDDETKKYIRSTGHNDFSSIGTVKAIVDMDTKKSLNSVTTIGVIGKNSNTTRFSVPDKFKNSKLGDDADSFSAYPVSIREAIAKELKLNPSDAITYKVGETEKVPSYKSTTLARSIAGLYNNQWKSGRGIANRNYNHRRIDSDVSIHKAVKDLEDEFNQIKTTISNHNNDDIDWYMDRLKKYLNDIHKKIDENKNEQFGQSVADPRYNRLYKRALDALDMIKDCIKTESANLYTINESMNWIDQFVNNSEFRENVGALTNIQSPQSLNKWMSNITPSYASKQDNFYHDMSDKSFNPNKHASLQPPKDIARSKKGSVFDKVELERFWFDKHGYRYAVLCVLIENEEHEIIVHPFIVYQQGKYICWFENSLPDVNGSIEFKKLDVLIYSVLKYVSKANNTKSKNAMVYYLDTPPKFGISHNEYIKYVTSQIELPLNDLPTKLFNESAESYEIKKIDNKYSIVGTDGIIISKMEYYIYDMNNFDWINIVGVDTHPDYRHQGYASLLLNELISDMDAIHPEMGLYLLVRTNNNPVINLYKKAGFSVLKTQKSDNGEFFIMYRGNADTTQLMNCNFNTESVLNESIDTFEEKSHDNLKYCYRVGFDANTGEQVAIEFDLDPNAITQIGDKRLTERIISKFNMDNDINQIHDDGREELIKNIKKYGCIDFVSKALRVNAIFTKDHKSLQTVKMVPMFSDVFQLAVKFASSTYPELKSGYITSIEDLIKYPKFKKDLADRIQIHPFNIESYTVGKNGGDNKYKMTKLLWDHHVLKSYQLTPILRGYNKIGRINNDNDALNYIAKNINNKFNENSLFEDIIQIHHSWGDPIFILPKQTEFDEEVSFMPVMDNDNHDYTIEEAYFKLLDMKYDQSIYMKESDESSEEESMPEKTDKKESDKNGVNRKKLYIAFIEWCKTFNDKNTFGSMFDKDVFHVTYPFVPEAMRYFYRLANPLMCILSGKLTFFQLSELRKVNAKNSQLANMMIFAATEKDMRVFNVKDGAVYMATEESGAIKLGVKLADSFDLYIQTMINRGDILNGADPTAAPDAPPEEIEAEDIPAEEEETETPIEEQEIDDNSDESKKETEENESKPLDDTDAPPEMEEKE